MRLLSITLFVPVLSPLPQLRCHPWWPDSDWQLQGRPAQCLWYTCWSHQWRNHIPAGLGPCPWKTAIVSWAWWEGGRLFHECTQVYFITWQYIKHVGGEQQGQKLCATDRILICTEYSAYFHTYTHLAPLNEKKQKKNLLPQKSTNSTSAGWPDWPTNEGQHENATDTRKKYSCFCTVRSTVSENNSLGIRCYIQSQVSFNEG